MSYLCRRRGRPRGRPSAALPSVQPQGKQTALASAFKAPPSAAEPGSGRETESRGEGLCGGYWGGESSGTALQPSHSLI